MWWHSTAPSGTVGKRVLLYEWATVIHNFLKLTVTPYAFLKKDSRQNIASLFIATPSAFSFTLCPDSQARKMLEGVTDGEFQ